MKTAIVSGANGFIGKHLVRYLLSKDVFVYAVVTNKVDLQDLLCPNLSIIEAFFSDYNILLTKIDRQPDVFFHVAWQGVNDSHSDYSLQLNNAIFAGKTFEIAEKLFCKKFVLASTINVLETKKIISQNEISKPLRFNLNYSMAKLSGEMICKVLAAKSKTTSFNTVYLSMVYGPNSFALTVQNVVMLKLIHGESPDLIKGEGLYDLIYIDDVVKGFEAVAKKGKNNKSYYLGHLKLRTFKEIFTDIGTIINKNIPLRFGSYPIDNYIDFSLINTDDILLDCGFEPTSDFEESIRVTVEWLKTTNLYDIMKEKKGL